jgi:hypothetical protein
MALPSSEWKSERRGIGWVIRAGSKVTPKGRGRRKNPVNRKTVLFRTTVFLHMTGNELLRKYGPQVAGRQTDQQFVPIRRSSFMPRSEASK